MNKKLIKFIVTNENGIKNQKIVGSNPKIKKAIIIVAEFFFLN